MTPEQKAEFDKTLADLSPESALAPQPMPLDADAIDQVMVDAPEFELPDSKASQPVDDALAAISDGSSVSKVLESSDPFATWDSEQAMQRPELPEDTGSFTYVTPPTFDMERHEQGKQALPQLDDFMRDMAKAGKLDDQGFLRDNTRPVGIGGDDVEEIRQEIEAGRDPGEALVLWVRKENEFKTKLVDALGELASLIDVKLLQLNNIIDGLIRRHS
jgi:hypothetical protein